MAKQASSKVRTRGTIERRGNSYRVKVYAGIDPVTGKRMYLRESTTDATRADRIRDRLIREVEAEERRRTQGALSLALRDWLRTAELEPSTRKTYEMYVRKYIEPALGEEPMPKVKARTLEELYAELQRCRTRCDGTPFTEHRIDGAHECRTVQHKRPPGRPPAGGHPEHDCADRGCKVLECQPHVCRPLEKSTIIKIHHIISATYAAAIRWEWVEGNPADVARPPKQPTPEPDPPTVEQVGRIVEAAWAQDEAWGTLVWLVMVTGLRRGELLALQWKHVDFEKSTLEVRHSKTRRLRLVALDPATVDILREHHERFRAVVEELGLAPSGDAYLFSYEPTGDRSYNKDWVTHRYTAMCRELGIESHLHALRHYAATELLSAGIDLRSVAGRLGHGGGGATTLKYYAAWVDQSDRRAADVLGNRVQRPGRRQL